MQSRFWLSTFGSYQEAAVYKATVSSLSENLDKRYQIRKGMEGKNIVFRVVERFDRKETEVINQEHNNNNNIHQRKSRRRRRKGSNPSPILY